MDNKELIMQIAEMMEEHTRRIEIKIEHDVTRRLDALTDGYKSVHEKQWELERQNEKLMTLLDDLQNRVALLESKTA